MTQRQAFGAFRDEVMFWQRRLGLMDWQIDVVIDSEDTSNRATTHVNSVGHSAVIILEKTWVEGATAEEADEDRVRRTAFHELCEVLIDDLESCAARLSDTERERARVAAHAVIRRLENCLFPLRWAIEKKERR